LTNPWITDDVKTLTADMREVHELIRRVLNAKRARGGGTDIPFWGGYLGYFSYEAGTDLFDIPTSTQIDEEEADDVSLLWVERSIVVDKQTRRIYVQSLVEEDEKQGGWLDSMTRQLEGMKPAKQDPAFQIPGSCEETLLQYDFERLFSEKQVDSALGSAEITKPDEQDYKRRIEHCQGVYAPRRLL
jgi:para-aminobenzoate synthetase